MSFLGGQGAEQRDVYARSSKAPHPLRCFNVKKAVLMVLTVPHGHLNKLNFFYTHRQFYWHIIHNCTLKIKGDTMVFYYENFWYEYFYIKLLSVFHVSYKYVGPSSAGLEFFDNFFVIS